MESISLYEFVNLVKQIDPDSLVKVKILDQVIIGDFRDVYEQVRELGKIERFTQNTKLTFSILDKSVLAKILAWIDELPGLLESIRLYYAFTEENSFEKYLFEPDYSKIESLYTELTTELETASIEADEYLQGMRDLPNFAELERKVNRMRLLTQPKLLEVDWFEAVESGNVNLVDLLMWNGQDVNEVSVVGNQAIHIAASIGSLPIVKLLFENGADINYISGGGYGNTPLVSAAKKGHTDIVRFFVDNGADINSIDYNNLTPLLYAVTYNHLDTVKVLLEYPAIRETAVNNSALCKAVGKNYPEMIKVLLSGGADPNAPDERGRLPLLECCKNGNAEIAQSLLDNGALLTDEMIIAAAISTHDNDELFTVLFNHGANIEIRDANGYTLLHYSVKHGNLRITKLLLNRGAKLDVRDSAGNTPLHIACKYNHLRAVDLLIKYGAKRSITNKAGLTPLELAEERINSSIVNYLSKL